MSSSLQSQFAAQGGIRGGACPQFSHGGLTARLALDERTRADAFGIRHSSYLSGGFIDPRPDGLFSDADDLKPNSQSIVIYKHRRPAASMRLCVLDLTPGLSGWDEIPASVIFPEAVAALAANLPHDRPARFVEINRLVRHPDYAKDFELVFVLFRFVSFMLHMRSADMMLNCVRRNHTAFYKRLHFDYAAGPRRYAGVKFETNLMACPEHKFHLIPEQTPHFEFDRSGLASYAGLLAGETVSVFGDV